MSNIERLAELFGGVRPLARALGLNHALVMRWKTRGFVPPYHNSLIRYAASQMQLNLEEVEKCLSPNVCPCCGKPLAVGETVPARFYSSPAVSSSAPSV